MPHIRVLRHYIHTPFLIASALEFTLIFAAVFTGHASRHGEWPIWSEYWPTATLFALVQIIAMAAMGVYESRLREGYPGMMLRTAVSIFLLGTMGFAMLAFFAPSLDMGRGVLLFSATEAFVLVAVSRWITNHLIDEDTLKSRVLILGTGHRSIKVATRMRRKSDRRAFVLVGFLRQQGMEDLVSEHGANVLTTELSLQKFCVTQKIDEIVIAVDERRRDGNAPGLPIDELLDCRTDGIEICEVQAFVEREAGKVDVDLLHPSWMIFSDGFVANQVRLFIKSAFDKIAALALLLLAWPIMLIAAFSIGIGSFFKAPILYRQERIGLDGKRFWVMKFRSMTVDAEEGGAIWASANDPRVTTVGAFIRKTRIDELPQLFNVLVGDMSFVGPRPERPMFVDKIRETVPFYDQRHKVKPGITGWAQLCYPYGASIDDAKEKLQYDLYYLKNHSLLLDFIILIQTVEVVLVGEGAR
ncbi:MAG: TIGR03013 family PEP-CTERM/XrtA system glycosyltransferase [Pseudomonadales bacterium]|nr:TIGR03013 family PEP-CTERM/XrtA system glycosyltransferase [Pseudomonadales bacterium]